MKTAIIYYGGFLKGSGGAFFHAKNTECELIRLGWKVEIITLDDLPLFFKYLPHLIERFINLFFRPIGYVYKAYITKFLYKILFNKKVDVRIFEDIYISWNSSVPTVTILHAVWSDNLQPFSIFSRFEKKFKEYEVRIINKIQHRLVTVSYPYKDYILNHHFHEDITKSFGVVELGLDQSLFVSPKITIHKKKSMVYSGALEARKNISFLLGVFKRLYELDPDYKLTIIGWGANRSKYEDFVKQNKLPVRFLGRLTHSEVVSELYHHELYIHTSVKESFSYSLLEAKLAGLKTIANVKLQVPSEFIDIGFDEFVVDKWCDGIMSNSYTPKIFDGSKYTSEKMVQTTLKLSSST